MAKNNGNNKKKLKLFGCELIQLNSTRAFFSIFKIRNIILKETLKIKAEKMSRYF